MASHAIDSRVYGANVRSSASFGDNIVGFLNQCDPVDVTGPKVGDRWMPCRAQIGVTMQDIFISENVLRESVSDGRENLVQECIAQWLRFNKGTGKEHRTPFFQFVGEFWKSINLDLDGKDRDVPWSAAFISYCVREVGGYEDFKFAAAHARYAHQAIRRKLDGVAGSYWGFKISDHKPEVGDMVCKSRAGSGVTYNFAADHDAYKSHCDIVTGISDTHVSTIGGNVSHSVSKTSYQLDNNGFLKSNGKVYAVLKNMN